VPNEGTGRQASKYKVEFKSDENDAYNVVHPNYVECVFGPQ